MAAILCGTVLFQKRLWENIKAALWPTSCKGETWSNCRSQPLLTVLRGTTHMDQRLLWSSGCHEGGPQVVRTAPIVVLLSLFSVSVYGVGPQSSQDTGPSVEPPTFANQLVEEMVQKELQAQTSGQVHWRYKKLKEESGKKELRDAVETNYGEIDRLLTVNDRPLTTIQELAEDARIQRLVSDPNQARARQQNLYEDIDRVKHLLEKLPTGFLYHYEGTDGGLIGLEFTPNPSFHPSGRLEHIFRFVEGTMWIDGRQKRLARIDGHLTGEIKFAGGLLGHLDDGGTFSARQQDMGSGHWEMSVLDIQLSGKALFFKSISVREKEFFTDYRPVPCDVTLRQAADILRSDRAASVNDTSATQLYASFSSTTESRGTCRP
jgi:hypothetical protein